MTVYPKAAITGTAATAAGHLIAVLMTWRRTYAVKKVADAAGIRSSIATTLLRDGMFQPPHSLWSALE